MIIGYVRTSHLKDDNYSISFQSKELQKYCRQNDLTLLHIFEDTFPGYTLEREGLSALITFVTNNPVTKVIIWRIDRLSRTKHHAQWVLGEYFLPRKIELHVTDKNAIIKDDLSSKIVFDIDAATSEEEHATIKKRTVRGRLEKLDRGEYQSGQLGRTVS